MVIISWRLEVREGYASIYAWRKKRYRHYRLISVISIISKVFERIIYNQFLAYLSDHI